jgi:phage shock protein A
MSLTPSRKQELIDQYNKMVAQLEVLESTLLTAYSGDTKSYEIDTAAGRQKATKRSLSEMEKSRDKLEASIARLRNKINGTGIVNLNLRRQRGGYLNNQGRSF